jgi:predicted nucleic acid-binding protein
MEQFAASSLTEYELGNVLWKEAKKKKINYKDAARIFSGAMSEFKKISSDGLEEILTLALERDLTFYDASYAYVAEKDSLILVTEDLALLKRCKYAIRTKDIEDT